MGSLDEAKEDGHRLVVRYSGTEPKLRILVGRRTGWNFGAITLPQNFKVR